MFNTIHNPLRIRPYREEDRSSVLEIYAGSKMDELKYEKRHFEFLPLMQDDVRSEKLFKSKIFVCEDADDIVGYCAFFENEIRALYVEPGSRERGVGHRMLEFLLNSIHGKPFLFVAKSNTQAKKLYQKYGFKVVDEFETKYNGVEVLANKMERIDPRAV